MRMVSHAGDWIPKVISGNISLAPEQADSARLQWQSEHCWTCLVIRRVAQSVRLSRPARIRGLRSVQAPECPVAQTVEITTGPQDIPSSTALKPGSKRFESHDRLGLQFPEASKIVG